MKSMLISAMPSAVSSLEQPHKKNKNKIETDEIYYEMALASSSSTTKEREDVRMIEVRKR